MSEEQTVEVEGVITAVLPNTMFRVELSNKHTVLGTISGRLRKNFIKLAVGDRVKMDMNLCDVNKGRITYRVRSTPPPSYNRSSHSSGGSRGHRR